MYKFYIQNKSLGKKYTLDHFKAENIPKSTIYSIIERAEKGIQAKRVVGSGRVAKKMNKKNISKLKAMFDHKDGISQRQAARKFKCLVSFVNKTLKIKTQIKAMRKKRIPDRSEVQKRQARQRCGRLLRKFKDFYWIMDDESYFTFKHSTINGNNIFYSSDVDLTSPNVQFNPSQV